jgi:hypothetical protein
VPRLPASNSIYLYVESKVKSAVMEDPWMIACNKILGALSVFTGPRTLASRKGR